MSRTQSQGIEYFPFAVDFFSDKKVKILKARYGADGIAIYLYLLCQIYREGYYTRVDEDFKYMVSDDLNMSADKVQQVMTFLFERSMFDEQLFKSDAILTSTGIQERWQKAVATRARKSPIKVSEYWLLKESETQPFIKCTIFQDSSEKKGDSSEKKDLNSENYSQSKVKESKYTPYIPQKGDGEREKARERFFSAYPKLRVLARLDDGKIDYNLLYERFSESEFLRTRYAAMWVYRNYEAIIQGTWRDEESAEEQTRRRTEWYRKRRERAEDVAEYWQKKAEAIPGYSDLVKQKKTLEIASAKAAAEGISKEAQEAEKALGQTVIKIHNLLKQNGIKKADLSPKFKCPKCDDTGFLPDGRACDCYEEEKGNENNIKS